MPAAGLRGRKGREQPACNRLRPTGLCELICDMVLVDRMTTNAGRALAQVAASTDRLMELDGRSHAVESRKC